MVTKIIAIVKQIAYGIVIFDMVELLTEMIAGKYLSTKFSTYVDKVHEEFRIEDAKEPEISLSRTEELEKVDN